MKTIATFIDPVPAHLAQARLEEAGIGVYLADEQTVGFAWHLAGAIGGIKLQVADENAEEALALLAENHRDDLASQDPADAVVEPTYEVDKDVIDYASTVEDEEASPNTREQMADRALRGAIFALFVFPLQLYVFWLLLKIFVSNEDLRSRHRRNAILAAIINLPIVLLLLGAVKYWLPSF